MGLRSWSSAPLAVLIYALPLPSTEQEEVVDGMPEPEVKSH